MFNFDQLFKIIKSSRISLLLSLFFILSYMTELHAQPSLDSLTQVEQLSISNKAKPDYLLAAAEAVGLNLSIWAYDRYLYQVEWARISFNSVKTNLNTGFVWDADGFETNQFAHPYHGSLYFSAARSLGIDYWRAVPYPFMGSLMWELFFETEYPSINDFITTPLGGIILGETTFRLSNLILFSGKHGLLREIGAFIVSPMNGLNRLISGKEVHNMRIKNKNPQYHIALSAGLNGIIYNKDISSRLPHLYINFYMQYGRYAKIKRAYKPFDYFETEYGMSLSEYNNVIALNLNGMLYGMKLPRKLDIKGVYGFFQSFDYIHNRIYKTSANSLGIGFLSTKSFTEKISWDNTFIASIILMGGINSLYAYEADRDYNLGPGAKIQFNSILHLSESLKLFLKYNYLWIHPLSGPKGNDHIDILRVGSRFNLDYHHSFNLEFIFYDRWSFYKYHREQSNNIYALRVYYSYTID